jgi:hypothetical protein
LRRLAFFRADSLTNVDSDLFLDNASDQPEEAVGIRLIEAKRQEDR